jgi:hypothetical protein
MAMTGEVEMEPWLLTTSRGDVAAIGEENDWRQVFRGIWWLSRCARLQEMRVFKFFRRRVTFTAKAW